MKVLIICVNYNSLSFLLEFLQSIKTAIIDTIEVSIVVVDNSSNEDNVVENIDNLGLSLSYQYCKNSNNGYFGGIKKGLECINNISEYDYVIGSNVDLTLANNFFIKLEADHDKLEDASLIAPSIINNTTGVDMNPQLLNRNSKLKYLINLFIFSFPTIYSLQRKLSSKKKNNRLSVHYDFGQSMYSAHGAFLIFTRKFFELGGEINYPGFLYGEEIYIAEQVLQQGKKIRYNPNLIVHDEASVSISKLNIKTLAEQHKKATKFFLKNYY